MITIGEKVTTILIEKKMSYGEAAKLTGLDKKHIWNMANNKSRPDSQKQISPRLDTLQILCNGLNYDLALFLAETGYLNPERVCMNDAEVDLLKAFRGSYDNNFIEINKNMTEKTEKGLEIGK